MNKNHLLLSFALLVVGCTSSADKPMKLPNDAVQRLEQFKVKPKFEKDTISMYLGLAVPNLKPTLTGLVNQVADDFIQIVKSAPAEKTFQQAIATGLGRLSPYELSLDTEDRERICVYFQDMMDIVGLESSGGQLNKWMYGFDPSKRK